MIVIFYEMYTHAVTIIMMGSLQTTLTYSNGIKAAVINKLMQICNQTAIVAWHTRNRTLCPREWDERKMITRGNPGAYYFFKIHIAKI